MASQGYFEVSQSRQGMHNDLGTETMGRSLSITAQTSRTLSIKALNERHRRAVKLRLGEMKPDTVAAQVELSKGTIIGTVKAY